MNNQEMDKRIKQAENISSKIRLEYQDKEKGRQQLRDEVNN